MIRMIASLSVLCLSLVLPSSAAAGGQPILTDVQRQVAGELARLDEAMQRAARSLGASGLTGDGARAALAELCGAFAFAVDCAAVDGEGKMVTIEPPAYRKFEGTDISEQDQAKIVIKKRRPVMSAVFRAVEGFDAADVEYSIMTQGGKYLGSVSLLFKPERLFRQVVTPLIRGIPVNIWVMEKNGRIIYDTDPAQVGPNLFTSPEYQPYTQLRKLGRRISSEPEGGGSYRYKIRRGGDKAVKKTASWKTVSLYGMEWRVVGVHVERGRSESRPTEASSAPKPEEKLKRFASESRLLKALSRGDQNAVINLFKDFFDATPGIYSIQWLDENGINRFGYPAENSLADYDHRQKRVAKDQEILDILKSRKKAGMEAPLVEGKTGVFNFVPVLDGDRYLGMVYIIRLKR